MIQEKLRYKSLLFLTIILLFTSCKDNSKDKMFSQAKYTVEIKEVKDSIAYEDVVDSYKLVSLETKKESLLGDVIKVTIDNDLIYVQDPNGIYCFNLDGKFKFAINEKGKGPEEFIHINSFNVDNNKIFIYDQALKKMLAFDALSGKFKQSKTVISSAEKMFIKDENIFMSLFMIDKSVLEDNNSKVLVSKLETPKKIIFSEFLFDPRVTAFVELYSSNNNIYWKNGALNEIYRWDGKAFVKHITFKGNNLTDGDIDYIYKKKGFSGDFIEKGKAFQLDDVYENSEFIIGKMIIGKGLFKYIIYDKQSKENLIFERTYGKYWDDFTFSKIEGVYKNSFYQLIHPSSLIWISNFIKKNSLKKEIDSKILKIYDSSKEMDNPSILFHHFRKIKKYR